MRAAMRFPWCVALVSLVALASCGPSLAEQRLARVGSAGADAQRLPGARQAQVYADAVHAADAAGDYRAQPKRLQADAADAIAVIDRALPSAGSDAPTLVAWRALLLGD